MNRTMRKAGAQLIMPNGTTTAIRNSHPKSTMTRSAQFQGVMRSTTPEAGAMPITGAGSGLV